MGSEKTPEGKMGPGGQVWTRRSPPAMCQTSPLTPQVPLVRLQPPSTHGCHSHPRAQRGGGGGTRHKSTPSSHSPAPGSQPSQTQVLSKGFISSSALCHPPDPKRSFLSVFPCAGVTVLGRAISAGRGNVINRPETFSLGGAG